MYNASAARSFETRFHDRSQHPYRSRRRRDRGGGRPLQRRVADTPQHPALPGGGAAQPGARRGCGACRVRRDTAGRSGRRRVRGAGAAGHVLAGRRGRSRGRVRREAGPARLGPGARRPHHALDVRSAGRPQRPLQPGQTRRHRHGVPGRLLRAHGRRGQRRGRERPADGDLGSGRAPYAGGHGRRGRHRGHGRPPRFPDRHGSPVTHLAPDDAPLARRDLVGRHIWCRVPDDIVKLRAADPALALRWRHAVRAVFTEAFAEGYVATGMSRDGWYTLIRPATEGAA
jgi:hypothetical protein